jgi:hypothetical protein
MAQQIKITQTSNADMNIGVRKTLTPVEWLALRYHHRQGYLSQDDIAEAKEMEKEQLIETWKHGNLPTFLGRVLTAEQYYNETYNK